MLFLKDSVQCNICTACYQLFVWLLSVFIYDDLIISNLIWFIYVQPYPELVLSKILDQKHISKYLLVIWLHSIMYFIWPALMRVRARDILLPKGNVFNPLTAKSFNLNFHPLEVVSRWRDPQLQVSENSSDLTKWRSPLFKSCWLMSYFIFSIFKMWYLIKNENPKICGTGG